MSESIYISDPQGRFAPGLNIERVLLSVTITSIKERCGPLAETAAQILRERLTEYNGVGKVEAKVLDSEIVSEPS